MLFNEIPSKKTCFEKEKKMFAKGKIAKFMRFELNNLL